MLRDHPQSCTCGGLAVLDTRPIYGPNSLDFLFYRCDSCDRFTFATLKEEYCRELWNASVDKSKDKIKK